MIIKSDKKLKTIVSLLKKQNLRIITTNGCFDLIHKGHVDFLKKSKALGDILIVGINSDSSIRLMKGRKRPVNSLNSRAYILDNLKPVDFVVPFSEPDPRHILKIIQPDIHTKGSDYNEKTLVEKDVVQYYGGNIRIIPILKNYSTTKIIKKIINIYES